MIKNSVALLIGLFLGVPLSAAAQPAPAPAGPSEQDVPVQGVGEVDTGIYAETFAPLVTQGGLTADIAARRAAQSAPSIERSRAGVRAAEASRSQAFQAVLPRLEVSAGYTRLSDVEQPSLGFLTPDQLALINDQVDMVTDPAARTIFAGVVGAFGSGGGFTFPVILDYWSLRATLSYPVTDLFLSILPAYEASDAFADAERLRLEAEQANVAMQAREAYYNHVRAQATLAVARATAAQTEANQTQVDALVQGGVAARVDLMRVQAQNAAARVGVARAEGAVNVTAHIVRTLMHAQGEGPLRVGENLGADLPGDPPPLADLVARALDQRAELEALERVTHARDRLASARAGSRWPHIAVQAAAEYSDPNQRIIPAVQEFRGSWSVGAVLSWSPNDTFMGQAQLDQADAETLQAEADLESLRDAIRIDVEQAYEQVRSTRASLEAAAIAVMAATEQHRVRQAELDAGTAVLRDVIDAQTDITRAQIDLVNAVIDLEIADAKLERAVGR